MLTLFREAASAESATSHGASLARRERAGRWSLAQIFEIVVYAAIGRARRTTEGGQTGDARHDGPEHRVWVVTTLSHQLTSNAEIQTDTPRHHYSRSAGFRTFEETALKPISRTVNPFLESSFIHR